MSSEQTPKNPIEKPKEKEKMTLEEAKILEDFQKEIADFKKKAKKEKITGNSEFPGITPNELTLEDIPLWKKYKSKLIRPIDVSFDSEYGRNVRNSGIKSRENLLAFFRQGLNSPWLEEQQKQYKDSKKIKK